MQPLHFLRLSEKMISKAIKLIRIYHKYNQAQLAAKLHISTSYLSELESGKKEPSLEILQRYADFFSVPLSSLVVFSETLAGQHSIGRAKSFLSKKMLGLLSWMVDQHDGKTDTAV